MIRYFASIAFAFAAVFASFAVNAQTIERNLTNAAPAMRTAPPQSILPPGTILAPNWPSKGYYYRLEGENMMLVFETETACTNEQIQRLPADARKGLFDVIMYNYGMTTIRAKGCAGIENGVATFVWFDGNMGKLDLDELFPISTDTTPPAVTPSSNPEQPRKPRI